MHMFGVLGWIVFGLIVGAIAKLLMPGRDPGGFIVTIVLGIVGALIGGFLGRALGWYARRRAGRIPDVARRRGRAARHLPDGHRRARPRLVRAAPVREAVRRTASRRRQGQPGYDFVIKRRCTVGRQDEADRTACKEARRISNVFGAPLSHSRKKRPACPLPQQGAAEPSARARERASCGERFTATCRDSTISR